MYRSLADMTPLRPDLVSVFLPQEWAGWEITFAIIMIVLSFVQKRFDHSISTRGIIGTAVYVSLVAKSTFAFAVFWDGINLALHPHTAIPKPFLVIAMGLIITQQIVNLIHRWTAHELVRGHLWPLALIEPREWAADAFGSLRARVRRRVG